MYVVVLALLTILRRFLAFISTVHTGGNHA